MKRKETATKEREYMVLQEFVIKRAVDTGRAVYFDVELNGVTIYGCRVIEGQNGDFIAFPSSKGKDGKYYNIAWAPLSPEDTATIISMIEQMINK